MQGQNFNNNQGNKFKDEIMKTGLVNLNNLLEQPNNRSNNNQKRFGNNNNMDDLFDI